MTTKFTAIDNDIAKAGKLVSVEIVDQMRLNMDYLYAAMPVGMIAPIMTNISGVVVDSNIWQLCDGSLITNENSPIRGSSTPNWVNRFVMGPANIGESGSVGGVNSWNFPDHSHTGWTSTLESDHNAEVKEDRYNVEQYHNHSIGNGVVSGGNTIEMKPPYYTVKFYMKIQ